MRGFCNILAHPGRAWIALGLRLDFPLPGPGARFPVPDHRRCNRDRRTGKHTDREGDAQRDLTISQFKPASICLVCVSNCWSVKPPLFALLVCTDGVITCDHLILHPLLALLACTDGIITCDYVALPLPLAASVAERPKLPSIADPVERKPTHCFGPHLSLNTSN